MNQDAQQSLSEEFADPQKRSTRYGTHPAAILSIVSGIASMLTFASCCIAPVLAPLLQSICGLIALGCGTFVTVRVRQGYLDRESNHRQAKIGAILGIIALLFSLGWLFMFWEHGSGLEFKPPPDFGGERSPLPFSQPPR